MTDDLLEGLKAEPKESFDRWGRREIVPVDKYGEPLLGTKKVGYQRVTTFIDVMDSTYNLERYQQRMVALGLVERDDLALEVASWIQEANTKEGKSALNKICDRAREAAKGSAAANTGTALHKLTELVDAGKTPKSVPAAYRDDLKAYAMAMEKYRVLQTEFFVVHDGYRTSGKADRLVEDLEDGTVYVGDLKTVDDLYWSQRKIAMQLALYQSSKLYDGTTGKRTDLGASDKWGLVLHLPRGKGECTIYKVPLDVGRWALKIAVQIRKWRSVDSGILVPVATFKASD